MFHVDYTQAPTTSKYVTWAALWASLGLSSLNAFLHTSWIPASAVFLGSFCSIVKSLLTLRDLIQHRQFYRQHRAAMESHEKEMLTWAYQTSDTRVKSAIELAFRDRPHLAMAGVRRQNAAPHKLYLVK
jgi:hypothetical protein